jgi:hypothetical protein
MSDVENANDPSRADDDDDVEGPYGDMHYAMAGVLLSICAALVLVGVVSLYMHSSSSHASGNFPADVTPTSQPPARHSTTVTTVRRATSVKKHPRTTPLPTVAPATVPVPVLIVQPPVVQPPAAQTRPRTPRVPVVQVETVVTQPPTTQPQQVVVPYTPPTQSPPDSIAVPIAPTSTPSG